MQLNSDLICLIVCWQRDWGGMGRRLRKDRKVLYPPVLRTPPFPAEHDGTGEKKGGSLRGLS